MTTSSRFDSYNLYDTSKSIISHCLSLIFWIKVQNSRMTWASKIFQHCVIKIIAWSLNSYNNVKILNHSKFKNKAKAMFMLINNLKKKLFNRQTIHRYRFVVLLMFLHTKNHFRCHWSKKKLSQKIGVWHLVYELRYPNSKQFRAISQKSHKIYINTTCA